MGDGHNVEVALNVGGSGPHQRFYLRMRCAGAETRIPEHPGSYPAPMDTFSQEGKKNQAVGAHYLLSGL